MESATFSPSLLHVLVAAVSSFVLGGLWYGPLFGKAWQRLAGLSDEALRARHPARLFGVSFVLAFAQAWIFAMFLGPRPALALGLGAGVSAGLGWVGAAFAINDLFERRRLPLWAINAGYHTLAFTLYGLIFGLWR
ncbi:MAG: DUF1761 domain-containing protein [Thermoanaerobaculia bacterium]